MITTLIILALSAVFFVNGKLRSDLVALCALVLLIVFNILTPEEALSGFSNPIVIMMVGLFVVGGAIFKTGLAKMISSKILRLAGKSELKLGEFYQFNLSSCIRQQNSLTAQFVSFSLANLANIFYPPPRFLQ